MSYLHRFRWPIVVLIFGIAAWRSEGWHQSDEHFQLLEFAGYKLGLNQAEDLAWEFGEQMRPALQVGMVYALHKVWGLFGPVDPFAFVFFLRLLSAAGFVGVLAWAYRTFSPTLVTEGGRRQLFWLSFGLWFMVYAGVRFSSENWAGICGAAAVLLGLKVDTNRTGSWVGWMLVGGLWGLAFEFRYQMAFAIAGYGLWLIVISKRLFWEISGVVTGGIFTVLLGTFADYWFYGGWTFAPWAYFEQNILAGKAATFGTDPVYQYLLYIVVQGIPPFGLVYLFGMLGFWWLRPRSPLTWLSVPFFLVHCAVSHKELRFLFPLLPFLPYAVCVSWEWLLGRGRGCGAAWFRWGRVAFWVVSTALLLGYTFRAPIQEIPAQRFVYRTYGEQTTVYYTGRSLWQHAFVTRFYRPVDLETIEVNRLEDVDCARVMGDCLYITTRNEGVEALAERGYYRVYGGYPAWLEAFNFNDWMAKSRFYQIYAFRRSELDRLPEER